MGAGRYVRNYKLPFAARAFYHRSRHPALRSYSGCQREQLSTVPFEKSKKALRIIVADATNPAVSCNGERLANLFVRQAFVGGQKTERPSST